MDRRVHEQRLFMEQALFMEQMCSMNNALFMEQMCSMTTCVHGAGVVDAGVVHEQRCSCMNRCCSWCRRCS